MWNFNIVYSFLTSTPLYVVCRMYYSSCASYPGQAMEYGLGKGFIHPVASKLILKM